MGPLSRRGFVRTVLGGAVGASFARRSSAQSPAFIAVPLTESLTQITGAAANIVVLAQPEGLLLVNGGASTHATALAAWLEQRYPGQRVRTLFNTDWHAEHTGFNARAAAQGAAIVAHENTRQWLTVDVSVKWQKKTYKALPRAAQPTKTFYTTGEMTFGAERIVYGHLGQAHTDGDLYVYFPGPNVLVTGDVVSVGRYPVMDYSTGGWIGGLAAAARTLVGVANAETRVVPGEGLVQTLAHLQAEQAMLTTVRDRVVKLFKSGLGVDEIIAAAPTKDFDAAWGSPVLFMKNMYPGLWGHARELGGII